MLPPTTNSGSSRHPVSPLPSRSRHRPRWSVAEESNVGELTVEQLQADIERIAQSYLRTPTRPLFAKSRAIRDRAFALLAGNQSPRQSRDLYSAAGWAITILAWMSVDLGRPDIAESHTRTAWACAEAADHDVLQG